MSISIRPAILLMEDRKILTLKYIYGGVEVLNLPGGNLELGEHLEEALSREMMEELGIEVEVGKMICVGDTFLESKQKHTFHIIFEGKLLSGTPKVNPLETSALDIFWLPIDELFKVNLYPNVSDALQQFLNYSLEDKYIGRISQQWF